MTTEITKRFGWAALWFFEVTKLLSEVASSIIVGQHMKFSDRVIEAASSGLIYHMPQFSLDELLLLTLQKLRLTFSLTCLAVARCISCARQSTI